MTDYISREALIAKIREEGVYGSGYSDEEREDNVVDMITSIPAADVAPVVRGKWFYGGQKVLNETFPVYICSNCKKAIPAEWERKCNFCPNCGADMREES
jgi:NADH pyrophosphatase NudC (nudix superfamily)